MAPLYMESVFVTVTLAANVPALVHVAGTMVFPLTDETAVEDVAENPPTKGTLNSTYTFWAGVLESALHP